MKRTIASAALLIGLAASGVHASDLTIAVQRVPDALDPVQENSNINLRIMYSLFDTLIKVDYRNGGKLTPGLADSWTLIDGKTVEFKLKEGVQFHNGGEMKAEDIVFTFSPERLGKDNAETGGTGVVVSKPFLGGIESVEAIDEYTVRISMKENDALILQRFANFPSQIVSKAAFEAAGSFVEFSRHPVGTGPYSLSDFVIGDHVTIEKFDGFHGTAPAAADTVTFTVVPEISTRIAGLRSGQFDIITEIGPDHIDEIENADNASITGGPVLNIRGLVYDSTNATLADPRIRRALNLSIDREGLTKALYQDRTSVPNGWQMDVFGDMYLADRPIPEFNIEKAKALLAEA